MSKIVKGITEDVKGRRNDMYINNCNRRWKVIGILEEEWVFILCFLIGRKRL